MAGTDPRFALMLKLIEGVGDIRAAAVLKRFRSHEQFCSGIDDEMAAECGISERIRGSIINFDRWREVDDEIARIEQLNAKIICFGDEAYPELLQNTADPPPLLYVSGDPAILGRPAVAVVGTRTPTPYGSHMARRIAGGLAARGIVIVSGLAWGIDTEAHRAALESGGLTVAVFGSGLDVVYPEQNKELARKIAENGCLITEFRLGTPPEKFNFPRRNRIISGLAQAVVVVEAAGKSGALVTAGLALEQGRDVFAVPGRADSALSAGTIGLIKKGAGTVTCAEDVLEAIGWHIGKEVERPESRIKLEPDEQRLCDLVGRGPAHFDELVRRLNLSPARISAALLKLELAGLISRRPGNFVARI